MPFEERMIVDLREEMALRALDQRHSVSEIAAMYGVTRPTVRLWRDRYRELGRAGLEDRSHATHSCPHRTSEEIEHLIIAERRRWGWGSKKILSRLEEAHPNLLLPKRATVDAILARHQLVDRRAKRKRQLKTPFVRRYEATDAGELTTIDHKAYFRLRNGQICFPLTIVDHVSRFLYVCEAMQSTSFGPTWQVVERLFRQWGLPLAMQSDNGPPFGPTHGRFSTMAVRLMMLDVQPVFSRPGRPGDNGRHERMHRELSAETRRPALSTRQQQKNFDTFRKTYNEERPHEGIAMQRPARLCRPSPRPFPDRPRRPDYPAHFETRKVGRTGQISWRDHAIFISAAFAGQTIALEPSDDGIWTVHFYRFTIGKVDERTNEFV